MITEHTSSTEPPPMQKDPLENLTIKSIETSQQPTRLLRHLLNRLPPEHQDEVSKMMLMIGWHHITANELQLLPFRVGGNGTGAGSTGAATTSNMTAFPAPAVPRDFKASWRVKPGEAESVPSANSPPPLPKSYRFKGPTGQDYFSTNWKKNETEVALTNGDLDRFDPDWLVASQIAKANKAATNNSQAAADTSVANVPQSIPSTQELPSKIPIYNRTESSKNAEPQDVPIAAASSEPQATVINADDVVPEEYNREVASGKFLPSIDKDFLPQVMERQARITDERMLKEHAEGVVYTEVKNPPSPHEEFWDQWKAERKAKQLQELMPKAADQEDSEDDSLKMTTFSKNQLNDSLELLINKLNPSEISTDSPKSKISNLQLLTEFDVLTSVDNSNPNAEVASPPKSAADQSAEVTIGLPPSSCLTMFNPMSVAVGPSSDGVVFDDLNLQNQSPRTLETNRSHHGRDVSFIPGEPVGEQFIEKVVQNAFLEQHNAEMAISKIRQEDNRDNLLDCTHKVDFKKTMQPETISLNPPTEEAVAKPECIIDNGAKSTRVSRNGSIIIPDSEGLQVYHGPAKNAPVKQPSESVKKYRPLPKYRPGEVPDYHMADTFDWTNKDAGAEESFNSLPIIQLAQGKLPPTNELKAQQSIPVRERQATDAASSGLVPPPSPKKEGFPPMVVPSDLPGGSTNFLEDHRLFCVLCGTNQHSTINCQEPPPAKIGRIRDLNLCKKCLDPSHNVKNCPHDFITCIECGMQHLDYIFHKPDNWTKKNGLLVNKNLLQKPGSSPDFKRF